VDKCPSTNHWAAGYNVKGETMSKTKVDVSMIHGWVTPGFEEVEAEFRKNFAERDELGAACAIYHKGKKVVDLWGGYRDQKTHAPWEEDTLQFDSYYPIKQD